LISREPLLLNQAEVSIQKNVMVVIIHKREMAKLGLENDFSMVKGKRQVEVVDGNASMYSLRLVHAAVCRVT